MEKCSSSAGPSMAAESRRPFTIAAVFLVALILPIAAQAQFRPYKVKVGNEPYESMPIAGGQAPVVLLSSGSDDTPVDAQLPFPFRFFDQIWTEAAAGENGLFTFGPISSISDFQAQNYTVQWTNQNFATQVGGSLPNQVIGVWWDDHSCLSRQNPIQGQLVTRGGVRWYVVQWQCNVRLQTSNLWEAQLWLSESGTIRIHHGPGSPSPFNDGASVGIESPMYQTDKTVSYDGLGCGSSCQNWEEGRVVYFFQGPDAIVANVQSPSRLYSGVTTNFKARVANAGGEPFVGIAGVRFWLSPDDKLSATDHLIGTVEGSRPLQQDEFEDFEIDAPLPWVEPGTWYVLAEADPLDDVKEDDEENNVRSFGPVVIGQPAPDLAIPTFKPPHSIAKGLETEVSFGVRNLGNLSANEVPWRLMLSANPVPTAADTVIAEGTVSVPALESRVVTAKVTLEPEIRTGQFYLAVQVDAPDVLFEIDEFNNLGASDAPTMVTFDGIAILTRDLPPAPVGATYHAPLEAAGGSGNFQWSLAQGTKLPRGLMLVEDRVGDEIVGTHIGGIATELGPSIVTLEVTSGEVSVREDIPINVVEGDSPLIIESSELPVAIFQNPYPGELIAAGGSAPYEWTLVSGSLPAGLTLDSQGKFRGAPLTDGEHSFVVRVRDGSGKSASGTILLPVAPPATLRCVTPDIDAVVGEEEELNLRLLAAGGERPYTFETLSTMRQQIGMSESEDLRSQPPPGLLLKEDGTVQGSPAQVGTFIWTVEVEDQARTTTTCVIPVSFRAPDGFNIATFSLPDLYAATPYRAKLEARGFATTVRWELANGSVLPDGLDLDEEGNIRGAIESSLLAGEPSRTYSFIVKATDAWNRTAVAPLSITAFVEPAKPAKAEVVEKEVGGCSASGGAVSLATLGLVLAALTRRRRFS